MIHRRSRWQRIKDKFRRKSRKGAEEAAGEGASYAAEGFLTRLFGKSGGSGRGGGSSWWDDLLG